MAKALPLAKSDEQGIYVKGMGEWEVSGHSLLGLSFQFLLILASWVIMVVDYRTQNVDSLAVFGF